MTVINARKRDPNLRGVAIDNSTSRKDTTDKQKTDFTFVLSARARLLTSTVDLPVVSVRTTILQLNLTSCAINFLHALYILYTTYILILHLISTDRIFIRRERILLKHSSWTNHIQLKQKNIHSNIARS